MSRKTYKINEIFYSLQGEGARAGTANVFVRFSKCNLKCALAPSAVSPGGWICDTDFESYREMTEGEIVREALAAFGNRPFGPKQLGVIFTGGEPSLQLDVPLLVAFHSRGFFTAIETNGTRALTDLLWLDWVTLSPKVPEERLAQRTCEELKLVVVAGDKLPAFSSVRATFRFLSPAFDPSGFLPKENLDYAIALCQADPRWRLSVQQHKGWGLR